MKLDKSGWIQFSIFPIRFSYKILQEIIRPFHERSHVHNSSHMTMILALSSFPKISISSYNHNAVLLDFENTQETKGYTNRKYLKNKAIFRIIAVKKHIYDEYDLRIQ